MAWLLFKLSTCILLISAVPTRGEWEAPSDFEEATFMGIVERMLDLENSLGRVIVYEDAHVDNVLFGRFCQRDNLKNALKGCDAYGVQSQCVANQTPLTSSTNYWCSDVGAFSTAGRLTFSGTVSTQKCAFAIYAPGKNIQLTCSQVPANYLKYQTMTPVTGTPTTVVLGQTIQMMNSLYLDAPAAAAVSANLDCTWVAT